LVSAGNRVGPAIANPCNGPGTGDPQYTQAIQLRTGMSLSKQRIAAHVYVTPDTIADGNPWDTLPPASYWNTQLSLAAGS